MLFYEPLTLRVPLGGGGETAKNKKGLNQQLRPFPSTNQALFIH